jgi:hypothetical protein
MKTNKSTNILYFQKLNKKQVLKIQDSTLKIARIYQTQTTCNKVNLLTTRNLSLTSLLNCYKTMTKNIKSSFNSPVFCQTKKLN